MVWVSSWSSQEHARNSEKARALDHNETPGLRPCTGFWTHQKRRGRSAASKLADLERLAEPHWNWRVPAPLAPKNVCRCQSSRAAPPLSKAFVRTEQNDAGRGAVAGLVLRAPVEQMGGRRKLTDILHRMLRTRQAAPRRSRRAGGAERSRNRAGNRSAAGARTGAAAGARWEDRRQRLRPRP